MMLYSAINMAGVRWVVGLQLILLILLFVAVLDFVVGSFIRVSPGV
jgi:solute carrier family 12 (potassium/chloride transporters), member 8